MQDEKQIQAKEAEKERLFLLLKEESENLNAKNQLVASEEESKKLLNENGQVQDEN